MAKERVLIVDDEELMLMTLKEALSKEGYIVDCVEDGFRAIELFEEKDYDIVLTDLKMPKMDGIELLQKIRNISSETPIIMMTAYATIDSAVSAMKMGAQDYISKPFSMDELIMIIRKALQFKKLQLENIMLHKQLNERYKLGNLIGKSKQMQEIYNLIETVAQSNCTVLIYGESGTGKELVAHATHHHSPRRKGPLIKVSCAALPETLLESELFGYEKGAFTDALSRKLGRFELANGGTLFLDDVDDMSIVVQVKLLRVLQEKEFERVGGTETIKADVRLIAASKRNLEDLVRNGTFREDLYYRLNVVPIYMPPLRERKEDIPLLVEHFLRKYSQENGKKIRKVSPEITKLLVDYDWPGNVRELENIIERITALSTKEEVISSDLPKSIRGETLETLNIHQGSEIKSIQDIVRETEKEHILKVLRQTNWHKEEAAKILNISRKTLWEKIKSYSIKKNSVKL